MVSSIERELTEATGVSKRKGEDTQKYLSRLADKVHDLPEDDWDQLSKDAQIWTNAAVKSQESKKPIAGFDAEDDDDQSDVAVADVKKKPRKKVAAKVAAKAKKVKTKKTKKVRAEKPEPKTKPEPKVEPRKVAAVKQAKQVVMRTWGSGEVSPTMALRQIVVKHPTLPVNVLVDRLKKVGHKLSAQTTGTIATDVRATLKALKATGLYDGF